MVKRAKVLKADCQILATTVLAVDAELNGVHSKSVWTLNSQTHRALLTAHLGLE